MTSSSPVLFERQETVGHCNPPREAESKATPTLRQGTRYRQACSRKITTETKSSEPRKLERAHVRGSTDQKVIRFGLLLFGDPRQEHYDRVRWSNTRQTMTHSEGFTDTDRGISWRRKSGSGHHKPAPHWS